MKGVKGDEVTPDSGDISDVEGAAVREVAAAVLVLDSAV